MINSVKRQIFYDEKTMEKIADNLYFCFLGLFDYTYDTLVDLKKIPEYMYDVDDLEGCTENTL